MRWDLDVGGRGEAEMRKAFSAFKFRNVRWDLEVEELRTGLGKSRLNAEVAESAEEGIALVQERGCRRS